MNIKEMWFYIWNKPYYKVSVLEDMEVIKTIIQPVVSKEKGYDIAIIDKKLKMAWYKIPAICFRDGKKFLMTVDINNAIPLIEERKITTSGEVIIKEVTLSVLKEQIDSRLSHTGKGKTFVKIQYPPTIFFQEIEAHFVKEALKNPPSKWEEQKWIWITLIIGIVVVIIFYLTSSPKPIG